MDRILEPGQIEALASRSIPRLILPERDRLFAVRAARLTALAPGHALEGYLMLVAALATRQQSAIDALDPAGPSESELARARAHAMPQLPARGLERDPKWRAILRELATGMADSSSFPPAVAEVCRRLASAEDEWLEARAEEVLQNTGRAADPASALFLVAALQVLWTALASRLDGALVAVPEHPGFCPVCGSLPVVSIVRSRAPYAGYRYLQCGLCATEWHRVRVECTQCAATQHVAYQSIEGRSTAIRAETCDDCKGYRKIFYQEHDDAVEALADDLASLALDLLLTDAGFHRASANPLYWQPAD